MLMTGVKSSVVWEDSRTFMESYGIVMNYY